MSGEQYIGVAEASKLTGIPRYTLYYLAKKGQCPAIRVPGTRSIRFPKRALLDWLETGRINGNSK